MEYTFRDIESHTGLSQATIRNWERRFSIQLSSRTPTNRRFFDEKQLQFLMTLSRLIESGQRPNDIFRKLNQGQSLDQLMSQFLANNENTSKSFFRSVIRKDSGYTQTVTPSPYSFSSYDSHKKNTSSTELSTLENLSR